jgi:membrane protease YdiL (CAAX protease family)
LARNSRLALGLGLVVLSMVALFTLPRGYFVAATFVSTGCMAAVAFWLGALRPPAGPKYASVAVGIGTAALLYLVFVVGGAAIDSFHPFGFTSASETSIYSLIASPSNSLSVQVLLLFFDSAGYEAFFRGVLQKGLTPRMGIAAAPAVALLDACIHLATLNPVWVGGTFVTDLVWGLTYHCGKGTTASFTSHFLWDLAIFLVRPIT